MSYVPSPAGFWKRYVAYFIDMVLLTIVLNVVATPVLMLLTAVVPIDAAALGDAVAATDPQQALQALLAAVGEWMVAATAVSVALYLPMAAAYFVWMEAGPRQATLGKRWVGLKVTDREGRPLTLARSLGRFVAATLSWLTLNLGHALAAWTHERRALHDYVAGTRVELADPAKTAMPGWGWAIIALNAVAFLAIALAGVASGVLLMQMHLQAAG